MLYLGSGGGGVFWKGGGGGASNDLWLLGVGRLQLTDNVSCEKKIILWLESQF